MVDEHEGVLVLVVVSLLCDDDHHVSDQEVDEVRVFMIETVVKIE